MLFFQILLWIFYTYLLLGLVVGIWFAFVASSKLDEDMQGAKWPVKLLLLPGSVALWPILLRKFIQHKA